MRLANRAEPTEANPNHEHGAMGASYASVTALHRWRQRGTRSIADNRGLAYSFLTSLHV